MLVNDYNHTAAHGLGAVMGSKKLKAIVAWGTRRPRVHDKHTLIAAGERWSKAIATRKTTVKKRLTSVGHGEDWGAITKLNWRSTVITDEAKGLDQNRVTLRPCFQCPRMCPWDVEIGEGRFKGKIGHFNAGSEWMDTFYNLGFKGNDVLYLSERINDLGSEWQDTFYNLGFKGNDVLYLSERINDLGIECSHFACGAGLAFEAWEKGALGPDKTDGLKLEWGNLEAVESLLERCARRETWLGNILADGPKQLAEALGGDAPQWAVHTKGGTPAMHEWRPLLGQMLRELVASGGMKPQGAGGTEPPADLRYREKWGPLDPNQPDGWTHSHLITERIRQACGLMGGCWFALNEKPPDGVQSMVDSLNATTGWNVSLDETIDVGHRAIILQSVFGTQRGWIAEHDWQDVGPRFLEPIPDGKFKGFTIAKWLPDLVYEYYRISGRHEKTGRPFMDTLQRLGLEEFKEWSQID